MAGTLFPVTEMELAEPLNLGGSACFFEADSKNLYAFLIFYVIRLHIS
jgi:hypothetical protein